MNYIYRSTLRWVPTALLVLACGCGDFEPDSPAKSGELGRGLFRYLCVGDTDPYCQQGQAASTFPERMAVGGRFALEFELDQDPQRNERFLRVSPGTRNIAVEANSFYFLEPGFTAFLAEDAQGEVHDFRHFYAAEIDRIAVASGGISRSFIELELGETLELQATPQDVIGTVLGGSVLYRWQVQGASVARVISADDARIIQLRGESLGTTELVVEAHRSERRIEVEVVPTGSGGDTEGTSAEPGSSGDSTHGATGAAGTEGSSGTDGSTSAEASSTGLPDSTTSGDTTGGTKE